MTPQNPLPFDAFTLAAVAAELNRLLEGARVQKVQQPGPADLVVSLYGRHGAHRLLLSADPQRFRVHLTQVKRDNPVQPPAFCQVTRKWLEGGWFEEAAMPRFDRLLLLRFVGPDRERVTLVAELMGRNSNVVLTTGPDAGPQTVRGVLRHGGERTLRPGAPYAEPPGARERVDPFHLVGTHDPIFAEAPADPAEALRWLPETFSGVGRFAAEEVVARAREEGGVPNALVALVEDAEEGRFEPHHVLDDEGHTLGVWPFVPLSVPPGRRFARESVSVALDTFYATRAEEAAEEGLRASLTKAIAREVAHRERELKAARTTLAEAERAEDYERVGNLIFAGMAAIPRGAAEVTLPDLYADEPGRERVVTLDPKKTPQENAESYFARARKARDAAEYADGKVADLTDDLERLRELAARLPDAADDDALRALQAELADIAGVERAGGTRPPGKPAAKKAERPFGGHRVRTYDLDGWTLLVGETAEANDHLMTRVAAPTDLWMHIRAGTGAHGVLRTNGQPTRVPDGVVRKACAIVAARSGTSVKHSGVVAVDVTERRYVRKPKGAKAGLALYDRARTYDVRPSLEV